MDLFAAQPTPPLAEALRPSTLDEVVGQSHLLGPGKPLRLAFESGTPHSMILWGPPGVGKTTLARLTATAFKCEFIALSAVFSGVKDIRAAMEQAQQYLALGKRTILFVDEIHRFNKAVKSLVNQWLRESIVQKIVLAQRIQGPSYA
ncbi:AAA family ATPase [Roseateles sp. PN1]|uniref:AAA family ATPase n=1 Tax=Roseateles sp. PN1 TaxID=3137372 RepID=UPI0031391A54